MTRVTERSPRPRRDDYRAWRVATTRWSDDDVYGHMNNARYFDLINTAVNAHLAEATGETRLERAIASLMRRGPK